MRSSRLANMGCRWGVFSVFPTLGGVGVFASLSASIGLYTHCGPDVLHMPSCKGFIFLVRVGACADEVCLMGGGRGSTLAGVSVEGRDSASVARKISSACAPPAIERMWRKPCGEGAYRTVQHVVSGGRRRARLCTWSRRFADTKGCSEWEGIFPSRLVIGTISKLNRYCSNATPRVHVLGSQRTGNSSTHVDRRQCLISLGSERANT